MLGKLRIWIAPLLAISVLSLVATTSALAQTGKDALLRALIRRLDLPETVYEQALQQYARDERLGQLLTRDLAEGGAWAEQLRSYAQLTQFGPQAQIPGMNLATQHRFFSLREARSSERYLLEQMFDRGQRWIEQPLSMNPSRLDGFTAFMRLIGFEERVVGNHLAPTAFYEKLQQRMNAIFFEHPELIPSMSADFLEAIDADSWRAHLQALPGPAQLEMILQTIALVDPAPVSSRYPKTIEAYQRLTGIYFDYLREVSEHPAANEGFLEALVAQAGLHKLHSQFGRVLRVISVNLHRQAPHLLDRILEVPEFSRGSYKTLVRMARARAWSEEQWDALASFADELQTGSAPVEGSLTLALRNVALTGVNLGNESDRVTTILLELIRKRATGLRTEPGNRIGVGLFMKLASENPAFAKQIAETYYLHEFVPELLKLEVRSDSYHFRREMIDIAYRVLSPDALHEFERATLGGDASVYAAVLEGFKAIPAGKSAIDRAAIRHFYEEHSIQGWQDLLRHPEGRERFQSYVTTILMGPNAYDTLARDRLFLQVLRAGQLGNALEGSGLNTIAALELALNQWPAHLKSWIEPKAAGASEVRGVDAAAMKDLAELLKSQKVGSTIDLPTAEQLKGIHEFYFELAFALRKLLPPAAPLRDSAISMVLKALVGETALLRRKQPTLLPQLRSDWLRLNVRVGGVLGGGAQASFAPDWSMKNIAIHEALLDAGVSGPEDCLLLMGGHGSKLGSADPSSLN